MSSWITARDQLATIIEDTTPATKKRAAGDGFRHQVDAEIGGPLPSRCFVIHPRTMAQVGATAAALQRRWRSDVDVEMAYDKDVNARVLYEIMMSDHAELARRLPDGSLWDRPTSGILNIFGDAKLVLPADIEVAEDTARVRFHFVLEFYA